VSAATILASQATRLPLQFAFGDHFAIVRPRRADPPADGDATFVRARREPGEPFHFNILSFHFNILPFHFKIESFQLMLRYSTSRLSDSTSTLSDSNSTFCRTNSSCSGSL
jgi:hypothetical protein